MKKALIIANLLFACTTVFGMDQQSVRIEEVSDTSQSANMTQVSSVEDKCRELFEQAQSGLAENKWLSENAKLLYNRLKFEDVWKEIKLIFFSDESKRNDRNASDAQKILSRLEQIFGKKSPEAKNIQTLLNGPEVSFRQIIKSSKFVDSFRRKAIESAGKRGAKLFYKQVLGDSELGKDLYKRAVREIDSAKCIPSPNRHDSLSSYNAALSGIESGYYDYDDLLLTLIHETGHSLDWVYRIRKTFGKPITKMFKKLHLLENGQFFNCLSAWCTRQHNQQFENISMFFETLLISSRFRGNLYPEDSAAHRFRIWETYLNLVYTNLAHELVVSYDKDQLNDLLTSSSKRDLSVVSKLKENNKIRPYIEILQEYFPVIHCKYKPGPYLQNVIKKGKPQWENLLKSLNANGYADLDKLFLDTEKGEYTISGSSWGSEVGSFIFEKNLEKRTELLPNLDGINWEEVYNIAQAFSEIYSGKFFSFFHDSIVEANTLAQKEAENNQLNLDSHTEGKYNALRLIKEKGYFDILERGESLPIEEAMEELTKSAEPLNLTKESIEKFFEFLRTGKLVS